MRKPPDILDLLREAEQDPSRFDYDQTRRLLRDAADVIVTLRALVGIREETDEEARLDALARSVGRP